VDTAFAKKPGDFIFRGEKALPGGVYMVVSPKKVKLFEFLINKNQHFNLQTDTANISMHLKAQGSTENTVFFSYLQYSDKIYKEVLALRKELIQTKKNTPAYKQLQEKIATLREENITKRMELIRSHPGTFVAILFEAMEEVRAPKKVHPADSLYTFHYLQKHFWDHFNLSDPRLLRSPMYDQKLKAYFKQMVPFQPDSVDRAIDKVIAMAQPSKECVSYLVWYFTVEYQNPKYMGFDKVFVHMVDQYFSKEPIENTSASILKLLKERAAKIRPLLIGNHAPELILQDTTGKFVSFYGIRKKLTLLFFWDYKCHICKRQLAELVPMYPELAKKYDLAVYAININPDLDNWKAAVRNRHLPWINVNGTRSVKGDFTKLYDIHGTPQLFLLDQNKRIIAKQFSVNQLKRILNDYVGRYPGE
jgi:thiol-disulfide isomerase/thioredoxin